LCIAVERQQYRLNLSSHLPEARMSPLTIFVLGLYLTFAGFSA
jgi:hypothetical protein